MEAGRHIDDIAVLARLVLAAEAIDGLNLVGKGRNWRTECALACAPREDRTRTGERPKYGRPAPTAIRRT
jgi:hypothetical protein